MILKIYRREQRGNNCFASDSMGVLGLSKKILAAGVASVRRCLKLLSCLIEPMPASSKTDPQLAKAESIRNDGDTPGIMCLRGGRRKGLGMWRSSWRRGVRACERNSGREGEEEMFQVPKLRFPWTPQCRAWRSQ